MRNIGNRKARFSLEISECVSKESLAALDAARTRNLNINININFRSYGPSLEVGKSTDDASDVIPKLSNRVKNLSNDITPRNRTNFRTEICGKS